MKKRWKGLFGLSLAVVLAACGRMVSNPNQDNWMNFEKGEPIVVGFDNTFVPMGFEEKDGSYSGFDVDLATAVSKELGVTITFQPIDWDMKETELHNGTIDAIWNGYTATDERRQTVAFTIPYMNNEQVLVMKKSSNITTAQDMEGKTLGAQAGSSGYLDFEAQPDILKKYVANQTASQYQSFNEALIDLQNDRIDGLLIDRVYANYYLQTEGILEDYSVFSVGFESESFAIGVRLQDRTLQEKLNQALQSLYQKGIFQEISQKWFGTDVSTKEVREQR